MSPHEQMKEGLYRGVPKSVYAGSLDNDKGTEYFAIRFEVREIFQEGEWQELMDLKKRDVMLWVTEKSAEFTTDKLEDLGLDVGELCKRLESAYEQNGTMLIGGGDAGFPDWCYNPGVQLRCSYRHSDGNTYERWDLDRSGGGGPEAGAVSNDTLSMMKSYASSGGSESGTSGEEDSSDEEAAEEADEETGEMDVSEEDIPF